MKILREMYEVYITAAHAHAKWEYEVAQTILSDRKRLFRILTRLHLSQPL